MAIKRVTISLPEDLVERIKETADEQEKSMSAWIAELLTNELDDTEAEKKFEEFLASVDTTPADEAWADEVFNASAPDAAEHRARAGATA